MNNTDDSVPPPPRKSLTSSAGIFANVNPKDVASAVVRHEDRIGHLETMIDHHEDRLGRYSQRTSTLEKENDDREKEVTELRAEVVKLQLFVARTEGERAMGETIKTVIPLLVGLAGLILSAWVAWHK